METDATLKAGDVCRDCLQLGLAKYLRYFKINLNGGTLLKCESNECMFPYNDEMSSSDEEEKPIDSHTETNSLQFINDFIKQCNYEAEVQNINNDFQINEKSVNEQIFDVTFLDDKNEVENKNICKPNVSEKSNKICDNKSDIKVIENRHVPLTTSNSVVYEMSSLTSNYNKGKLNENANEQIQFDVTFLEDKSNVENDNLCKLNTAQKCDQLYDNKLEIKVVENRYVPLITSQTVICEIPSLKSNNNNNNNNKMHNKITNENANEQIQFDFTFLDDKNEVEYVDVCKANISENGDQLRDNKLDIKVIEDIHAPLIISNSAVCEIDSLKSNNNSEMSNKITNVNVIEQIQFDITFLDEKNKVENENTCKPNVSEKSNKMCDNKSDIKVIENRHVIENKYVPSSTSNVCKVPTPKNNNEQMDNKTKHFTIIDCKQKIDIQSIETIKLEKTLCDNLPTSSKILKSLDTSFKEPQMPVIPSAKTVLKSRAVSKKTKLKNSNLNTNKNSKPPITTKTKTLEIPKADIIKGNALLKNLPALNRESIVRCRKQLQTKKTTQDNDAENQIEPSSTASTNTQYNTDMISKLLTNRIKGKK